MVTKAKVYVGAKEEEYTSVYGYTKYRFPVKDAESGNTIGFIKQEIVHGLPGEPDTLCYYERNNWRNYGFPLFYQSPEALLTYLGFDIDWKKNNEENGVGSREKKAVKKSKPRNKKVVAALEVA